jgi:DNA-binding LacI/PurR family transcriptional regulator
MRESFMEPAYNNAVKAARDAESFTSMAEAFKQKIDSLLKKRSITAWVFANDSIANVLLSYARMRCPDILKRIAVVSFDNSARAIQQRLTSFDFNLPAIAQMTYRHVMKWPLPAAFKKQTVVELDGIIVERESSILYSRKYLDKKMVGPARP